MGLSNLIPLHRKVCVKFLRKVERSENDRFALKKLKMRAFEVRMQVSSKAKTSRSPDHQLTQHPLHRATVSNSKSSLKQERLVVSFVMLVVRSKMRSIGDIRQN